MEHLQMRNVGQSHQNTSTQVPRGCPIAAAERSNILPVIILTGGFVDGLGHCEVCKAENVHLW